MKIAVTYEDGQVFQHFGHTERFKLYEVEDGNVVSTELLESNGETVLWHCTSGKDRTGIEAVMLMAALGFDEEQIRAEYLNTNVLMAGEMQAAYDKAYKYTHSNKIATEFFKYEGVQESWLDVALSVVDRYGGLDSYLRGTIGLTDADFAQLQQIYLEPAA